MESPKRGCDLGPCVVIASAQKTHCDHLLYLEASLGSRVSVQLLCVQKTMGFAFALLSPL